MANVDTTGQSIDPTVSEKSATTAANPSESPSPPSAKEEVDPKFGATTGPIAIMLTAALALLIAAAAVLFFAVLQTAVACQFKPVTYAIFTGIVLAAFGAVLGGSAVVRGNLQNIGVGWTVGGGAAFLLIVMGVVLWATRVPCDLLPTIQLSAVPSDYAVARNEPAERNIHLRVRFENHLWVAQNVSNDVGYQFLMRPTEEKLLIYVDMIKNNRSVEVCKILVSRPSAHKLKRRFWDNKDYVQIEPSGKKLFELQFRSSFIEEIYSKYAFDKAFKGTTNACIEVPYYDKAQEADKTAAVTEIYLVEPSILDRVSGAGSFDLSALTGEFKLYALKAAQQPADVDDKKSEPNLTPKSVPVPTQAPLHACPQITPESPAQIAFNALLEQGTLERDEIKLLYENWCAFKQKFFTMLVANTDNVREGRLARFLRTSITAVDTCWASSDTFREKNAESITQCRNPRLDEPRDLSRKLPFAETRDDKYNLIDLLRDDDQARRETETLLRAYPHDEFHELFQNQYNQINSLSADVRQTVANAAIGYYYNRVVEQAWSKNIQDSLNVELDRGLRWTEKLTGVERAVARARLFYGRAHSLLQITTNKSRPAEVGERIQSDFKELVRLTPEEMSGYPYPHHLARAVAYVNGTPQDARAYERVNTTRYDRVPGGKPSKADVITYESSLNLRVLPRPETTVLKILSTGDAIRVLMTYVGEAGGKKDAWDFVATPSGAGWLKRQTSPS